MKWLLGGGGVTALLFAPVFLVLFSVVAPPTVAVGGCGGSVSGTHLDAEGSQNAATIISTVQSRHLPQRAAVIAIATSLVETGGTLHNINHGDAVGPDSRGLFQQRASWGPEAVRMDPAGATGLFLDALVKVGSWETRPLGSVAQEIQKSADSTGQSYADREAAATAIVGGFQPSASCSVPSSGPGQPGNPLDCPHPPITQGFGPSALSGEPAAFGYAHFHTGIDLACIAGTPIHNIEYAGLAHVLPAGASGGFGNMVVIEVNAPTGHYFVRYAHMQAVQVADNTQVNVGDRLGYEGCTGYCTGPHLHFEVDKDKLAVTSAIDPSGWLAL